ncbi:hypothetical protein KGY73_05355 [bacterium]|nr:hypothetical protein [bacterium]
MKSSKKKSFLERLEGWKAISNYLDKDVRTCQRWEEKFNLPVYRVGQSTGKSRIFSYKSELDEWWNKTWKNAASPFYKNKYFFAGIISLSLIVLAVVIIFFILRREKATISSPNPVSWKLKGHYLAVYDIHDHFLWKHKIESSKDQEIYYFDQAKDDPLSEMRLHWGRTKVTFSDVDQDRRNEVLCFLNHENPEKRCVALVDNDGEILWTRSIRFDQEYVKGKIVNDYLVYKLKFHDIDKDNKEEILVLWSHSRRFPSIFVIYNLQGKEILRYSHTGNLPFFQIKEIYENRKCIFLAGTNNLLNGSAVLSILDCSRLKSGLGPPYSVPPDLTPMKKRLLKYKPVDYVPAHQKEYLRFKHNEFSRKMGAKWLKVIEVRAGENEILIKVHQSGNLSLYFVFDSDFHLRYVKPGADLERKYEELLDQGVIQTPLEKFLKECRDDVLFWTGEGWSPKPPS